MNETVQAPPLLSATRVVPCPTFLGASRGLWSFTWRSRLALRRLPIILALLLAIPILTWLAAAQGEAPGEEAAQRYFRLVLDVYFFLVLPLYCLFVCGAMIRDELQDDTLPFLITRPLRRAGFVVIKYLCEMTWLQIVAAIEVVLLIVVGNLGRIEGVNSFAVYLLLSQVLAVAAWCALSTLLGLINRRYLVLGIVYGFIVELGIGRIPTNINSLSDQAPQDAPGSLSAGGRGLWLAG